LVGGCDEVPLKTSLASSKVTEAGAGTDGAERTGAAAAGAAAVGH